MENIQKLIEQFPRIPNEYIQRWYTEWLEKYGNEMSAKAFIIAKAIEQHEIEKQDYNIQEILMS